MHPIEEFDFTSIDKKLALKFIRIHNLKVFFINKLINSFSKFIFFHFSNIKLVHC